MAVVTYRAVGGAAFCSYRIRLQCDLFRKPDYANGGFGDSVLDINS